MTFPLPLPPGTDTHYISQLGATTYTQSAVHFNEGVFLTSADGFGLQDAMSFSLWFDMPSYTPAHNSDFNFFHIPIDSGDDTGGVGFSGTDDWLAPGSAGTFYNYWPDATDGFYIAIGDYTLPLPSLIDNQWHHLLCTVSGDGTAIVYVDDQIRAQINNSFWPPGTQLDLRGAMKLPNEVGPGQDVYVADIWFGPGIDLRDPNTGLIPTETRRQFVSDQCQPVDPTGWPTSAVQFYGNAAAFVTNRGTGPSFTLTGVLENTGAGASPGARVQINGLKGGIYNVAAYAADWTGSAAYALCPVYGYNAGLHQFTANEVVWIAYPAGSMVIQKYGTATPDIAITRIHTTLPGTDQPCVINGITDDTPFVFAGGCGYLGTVVSLICGDWNSSSVDFQMLQPNGQWITIQTFSSDSSVGLTLAAGTYRLSGAASLAAPIYGTISAINIHSNSNISFVGITEVTEPFHLSGGATGLAGSCADASGDLQLSAIMPDGSLQAHYVTNNRAALPYLSNATYVIDPTNLADPLTVSITGTPLIPTDTRSLILTDDSQSFTLQGSALEYQMTINCADWNGATATLEYQTADGSWVSIPNMSVTSNSMFWPTTGAGTYRVRGVSDMNAPAYLGISNTPCVSTDTVSFNNLTEAAEFQLQGGQYMLSFSSYNNDTAHWLLNFQAPDGTWTNINSYGDTAGATSWQWYATGRYQIDASAMTNGVNVNISSLPL